MICIYCTGETEVPNSRQKTKTPSVWRRRVCKVCQKHFTTIELPDYTKALFVTKTGSKKPQPLSRDKLFLSLYRALGHRDDATMSASALTTTVLGRVLGKRPDNGLITAIDLAKASQEVLKRYDPLAAGSYKAYHQATLKLK